MTDGGKGSRPRPFSVSDEEYARRWDAIFGRDQDRQTRQKSQSDEKTNEKDHQEHQTDK